MYPFVKPYKFYFNDHINLTKSTFTNESKDYSPWYYSLKDYESKLEVLYEYFVYDNITDEVYNLYFVVPVLIFYFLNSKPKQIIVLTILDGVDLMFCKSTSYPSFTRHYNVSLEFPVRSYLYGAYTTNRQRLYRVPESTES